MEIQMRMKHTKVACGKAWKGVWLILGKPLSQNNVSWISMVEQKTMLK